MRCTSGARDVSDNGDVVHIGVWCGVYSHSAMDASIVEKIKLHILDHVARGIAEKQGRFETSIKLYVLFNK